MKLFTLLDSSASSSYILELFSNKGRKNNCKSHDSFSHFQRTYFYNIIYSSLMSVFFPFEARNTESPKVETTVSPSIAKLKIFPSWMPSMTPFPVINSWSKTTVKPTCATRPFQISAFFFNPNGPRPSLKFHCLSFNVVLVPKLLID